MLWTRVSAEIAQRLANDQAALELLNTIPGMGQRAAEIMLAEIGTEMARFPSAKHLASWAGMCPGNKESGGKRLSGKTRKGHIWLQHVLFEVAHAASKTKDTYLSAQFSAVGYAAEQTTRARRPRAQYPGECLSHLDPSCSIS